MSKKLGEILIEAGAITDDELEAALRNQLMLGGHLGSCLLELGFVDEKTLGAALAESTGVPCAVPQELDEVDPAVLQSLPKRLVEEYQAVPFHRNDRVLEVAMVNPRDLLAIDALSFASGCRILPWVSPEARVLEAMERLYDIPRRTRYIVLSRTLTPLHAAAARDTQRQTPADEVVAAAAADTKTAPPAGEPGLEYGYGRSWVEVAEELSATNPSLHESEDGETGAELVDALCAADDKDTIARAVLAHARRALKRAALFIVQGDEIVLWRGAGFGIELDPSAFGAVEIRSLELLEHLLGSDHYRGPLRDSDADREIYDRMGVPAPAEILLVPVHINDRLVALLLGDGGQAGPVVANPRDMLRLGRMLALALNLLILKKKIRNLGAFAGQPAGRNK